MFAITAPILIAALGLAVDISNAISIKSRLTAAADAAVMAGVKAGSDAASEGDASWLQKAIAESRALFDANIHNEGLQGVVLTPTFTRVGTKVEGVATYSYDAPTYFMNFFGYNRVEVGQTSKAAMQASNFIDVGFLIDNSGSMGIGATEADQRKMFQSEARCAFACHVPRWSTEAAKTPQAAHSIGATLRIDVVKQALKSAVKDIEEMNLPDGQIRIALYTFSIELNTLLEPTTDLNAIKKAIDNLELAQTATTAVGGTYVTSALASLPAVLDKTAKGGDGTSRLNRKSFVVLFTDGIDDSSATKPTDRTISPPAGWLFKLISKQFENYTDETSNYRLLPTWQWNPDALNLRRASLASRTPEQDGAVLQPFLSSACNELKKTRTVISARIKHTASVGGLRGIATDLAAHDIAKLNYLDRVENKLEQASKDCASNPTLAVTADNSAQIGPMFRSIVKEIIQPQSVALTY